MAFHYSLYGLRLAANLSLSGLPTCEGTLDADVEIHLREKSRQSPFSNSLPSHFFYVSSNLNGNGQPVARIGTLGNAYYGFFYCDGAKFAVRSDGREIWADGPEDYSIQDLATYLVGPVIGFVLRLLRILPLHACAIGVEGGAIALVGSQGAGKSTTAAAFAKMGFAILSEDVVAITEEGERHMVQPGYPRINLWPESAEAIFGDLHGLPPVTPTWGKYFLALDDVQHGFQNEPLELAAIFLLRDRIPGALKSRVEKVAPALAMTMLVANTYVNYLLDAAMRRTEFVQLGRLLRQTPVYQVWPSDDPTLIYDLCTSISTEAQRSAMCLTLP